MYDEPKRLEEYTEYPSSTRDSRSTFIRRSEQSKNDIFIDVVDTIATAITFSPCTMWLTACVDVAALCSGSDTMRYIRSS